MRKIIKGIAPRIAAGYLVVVLLTGLLMGSSFWLLLSRHLEEMARESLRQDARSLAAVIDEQPQGGMGIRGMMHRYATYRMLGRVIQGEYLLVNPGGLVIESSIVGVPAGSVLDPSVVSRLAEAGIYEGRVTLGEEEFVAAARYLEQGVERGGAVVLLTRVEGLREIHFDLLSIFLYSLGVAILVAMGIAWLIARRISRPLTLLKEKAHRVAERNFGWQVRVEPGDEIGDLGRAINAMDEKLAKYDRVQRQFFQNASHELKSPLMSIQGYAEGIKDGIFQGGEAERALDVIVRETGRMKSLVEELVYLGQLEGPSGVYSFEDTDLTEILEQAVESQRVLALEKGVVLDITACPEANLRVDGGKMVRVFVNLIANAVRHAVSRVEVIAVADGDKVKVMVRDDGTGFTEEDLKHLWDRFYKGPRGGSGLGLPIARAIVEEHGGTIQARNLSGGGAEIEVVLSFRQCG